MLKFLELKILVEVTPGKINIGVNEDGEPLQKNVWIAKSSMVKMVAYDDTPEKAVQALAKALADAVNVQQKEALDKEKEGEENAAVEKASGKGKRGRPKKQKEEVGEGSEDSDTQLDMDFD